MAIRQIPTRRVYVYQTGLVKGLEDSLVPEVQISEGRGRVSITFLGPASAMVHRVKKLYDNPDVILMVGRDSNRRYHPLNKTALEYFPFIQGNSS
ncbi:MAG: hypothetical protein JSW08_02140 [archaeon]|nr:MAG: hypothetical protein JSW08_02140 [archaeon]